MSKKIFISNSTHEGKKLARQLGHSFCQIRTVEKYPDTEKVIGIREKIKKPADIIHWQFNNLENIDEQIFNLLAFVNKFSNPRITRLVLPYMPYGRGNILADNEVDKLQFLLRELSKMVKALYLVVVHYDFKQSKKARNGLKNIFVVNVDNPLSNFLKKKFNTVFVLVSPDEGFSETVKRLAKKNGVNYLSLTKQRLSPLAVAIAGTPRAKKIILKNKSKKFIIVDDIVSTGATLTQATKFLLSFGVKSKNISYVVVHDTRRNTFNKKISLFSSNSLNTTHPAFDVTESIVKTL